MPLNDNYRNPGSAATSALFDFLADREAKQRQAQLDDITRSTAARQDEMARANLELQREQMTGLREQREAAADVNRQKKALGVIGMLSPGAAIDAPTADMIRQGGFGPLLQAPGIVAGMPREANAAVADEVDSALLASDPNALRTDDTFRGTPQQMEARQQQEAMNTFLASQPEDSPLRLWAATQSAGFDAPPAALLELREQKPPVREIINGRIHQWDPQANTWSDVGGTDPKAVDAPENIIPVEAIAQTQDIRAAASELLKFVEGKDDALGPNADFHVRLQQQAATGALSPTVINQMMRLDPRVNREQAMNVAAQLDTVRALIIQRRMDLMRMRSAVGATGLGQLSEREAEWLAASEGALSQAQSPKEFKAGLNRIITRMNEWEQRRDVQEAIQAHQAAGRLPGATASGTTRRYNPATGRIE